MEFVELSYSCDDDMSYYLGWHIKVTNFKDLTEIINKHGVRSYSAFNNNLNDEERYNYFSSLKYFDMGTLPLNLTNPDFYETDSGLATIEMAQMFLTLFKAKIVEHFTKENLMYFNDNYMPFYPNEHIVENEIIIEKYSLEFPLYKSSDIKIIKDGKQYRGLIKNIMVVDTSTTNYKVMFDKEIDAYNASLHYFKRIS